MLFSCPASERNGLQLRGFRRGHRGFRFNGITDAEIKALGIAQGVAGNTAKKVGDCMPLIVDDPDNPPQTTCRAEPLDAALWLLPESNADTYPVAALTSGCRVDVANRQPSEADAIVVASLSSGRYGVEVPPGRYMPIIVEENGCGTCVKMSTLDVHACSLIEVEQATVTKLDVVLDRAAH